MAKWFKDHILDFDMQKAVWHPKDVGPIYDWNQYWRDPVLESYLKSLDCNKGLPIGELKGKKRYFKWFTEDADSFMSAVGNDGNTWFTESDQYRRETLQDLQKNYILSIQQYFPNKEGKITVPSHPPQGKEAQGIQPVTKTVPFGPWVFWSRTEWQKIDRQWSVFHRKALRNLSKSNDQDGPTQTHTQSHTEKQVQIQDRDQSDRKDSNDKPTPTIDHPSDQPSHHKSHRDKSSKNSRHKSRRSRRNRDHHRSDSRSRSRSRSRDNHHHSHRHKSNSNNDRNLPIHSDDSQVSS